MYVSTIKYWIHLNNLPIYIYIYTCVVILCVKTFVLTSRKGERRWENGGGRYGLRGHGKNERGRRGTRYRVAQGWSDIWWVYRRWRNKWIIFSWSWEGMHAIRILVFPLLTWGRYWWSGTSTHCNGGWEKEDGSGESSCRGGWKNIFVYSM